MYQTFMILGYLYIDWWTHKNDFISSAELDHLYQS